MNLLFLCSQNKLRSPTAEYVAKQMGFSVDSAGLEAEAIKVLQIEQIQWADSIFVMENHHKKKLIKKFSQNLEQKNIITLGIPDDYECMQPELIEILEKKLPQFLTVEKTKFKHK